MVGQRLWWKSDVGDPQCGGRAGWVVSDFGGRLLWMVRDCAGRVTWGLSECGRRLILVVKDCSGQLLWWESAVTDQ